MFDTLPFRLVFTFALLAVNLLLKKKSFGVPIDFDTANHLYFAYLTSRKIPFKSSYRVGIKYLLPRLYAPLVKFFVNDNWQRFRVINIFSSSLVIVIWVFLSPHLLIQDVLFIVLGVLLINSLWVNYATSATEFHEVVLLLVMVSSVKAQPFELVWIIQMLALLILVGGFKFVNIAYLLPLVVFQWQSIIYHPVISVLGLIIPFIAIFVFGRKTFFSARVYSKTRSIFHVKSVNFFKGNLDFVSILGLLTLGNLLYAPIAWRVLVLTIILIQFAQKMFAMYFFYPLLVVGIFIGLQTEWFSHMPVWLIGSITLMVFVFHTLRYILTRSGKEIDVVLREKIVRNFGWDVYLDNRMRQLEWIRANIPPDTCCYLWGTNVPLLLLGRLSSIPGFHYSHNHLLYWDGFTGSPDSLLEQVILARPAYIIESLPIGDFRLPANQLAGKYQQVYALENLVVYRLTT